MLKGEPVTIEDMMYCRDRRADIQQSYIEKYHCPILSFALNIPGPIKTNPQLHTCFTEAVTEIKNILNDSNTAILDSVILNSKTGDELLLCFNGDAATIKNKTTRLEEKHPLGRLYDIDIIDVNGEKLSRPSFRKCLICNCQAQDCARSRKHTIEELQNKILNMLKEAGY